MMTPSFGLTATERVLPKLALNFTTASLDSRITFTRTTNASNPATYINSSGVITAATNNQPRFDYDPVTLVCKGLLIEESRTNALLNSDSLLTQIVTVTAAARTLSFYGTGQIVLSGTASATITGTGAYPTRTTYTFTPTAGALTLTVTGTVQYAQMEIGSFATSYIPTTTTALTRNPDVAVMTGTNFSSWYNTSYGTLECQFDYLGVGTGTLSSEVVSITTAAGAGLEVYKGTGGSSIRVYLGTNSFLVGTISANVTQTVCTSWSGTSAGNACLNGGTVNAITPTAYTPDRMTIGGNPSTTVMSGHIKQILYWPQKLTNNEVQAFSKG